MSQAIEVPTFQDEQVRLSVHHKPSCIVEFEIEALPPLAQEAYRNAVKTVSKAVSLPGFRKGKVPDSIIVKNYGSEIDKEYQQELSDLSFRASAKLTKIFPLSKNSKVTYKMKSHSLHGALLTLSFEVEPTLPSVDAASCRIKSVKRPDVNEEKIQETIRQVQFFFANWKAVEDRPVALGDFVLLDVDVIEETPAEPLFQNTRFEVTEKGMAKWMLPLVLGKNIGDVTEGVSVPDQDASPEDLENLKPKKVSVTVRAIDTATLPEVDDAFVKQLGADSVEVFHTRITELLNKQADAHVLEKEREQVTEFLLNECPFDLPQSLTQQESQTRLQQLSQDAEFINHWKSLTPEKRQETLATVQTQSEKAVRLFYLCRKILADQKIQISAQDLPKAPDSPLGALLEPHPFAGAHLDPKTQHAEAFARLVLEKAGDYVRSQATRT